MFTGIVQAKGTIGRARRTEGLVAVDVRVPPSWKLAKGQSIAVDGVCITVTALKKGQFSADLMPETLRKTTGGSWKTGRVVNLERALRQSDLLDGHLLQGHVASRATVSRVRKDGRSRLIDIMLPAVLMKRVALYGSVAINGVSLTVARRAGRVITVAIIPYTLAHTNLGSLKANDQVNVETDFLGSRATVVRNATRRVRKNARG